jgi:hypothetical protein
MNTSPPQLVGAEDCLQAVFPAITSRPALRTFRSWQAHGLIPYHKIGRSTYFDPGQVRAALDRRCKIEAKPAH